MSWSRLLSKVGELKSRQPAPLTSSCLASFLNAGSTIEGGFIWKRKLSFLQQAARNLTDDDDFLTRLNFCDVLIMEVTILQIGDKDWETRAWGLFSTVLDCGN